MVSSLLGEVIRYLARRFELRLWFSGAQGWRAVQRPSCAGGTPGFQLTIPYAWTAAITRPGRPSPSTSHGLPLSHQKLTYDRSGGKILHHTSYNPYSKQNTSLWSAPDFIAHLTQFTPPWGVLHQGVRPLRPGRNHFFAFAAKDALVSWLEPKPLTYRSECLGAAEVAGLLT